MSTLSIQKIAVLLLAVSIPMSIAADSPISAQIKSSISHLGGARKNNDFAIHQGSSNYAIMTELRGGGVVASKTKRIIPIAAAPVAVEPFAWFKPGMTVRAKWLGFWLLLWNSMALVDALMFTFRAKQNLDGYLIGEWGPHTLAMTRMLANCQLGLIATIAMVALVGDEKTIKNMFKILILVTLGAFRSVFAGVAEGTIKAPWKTGYASALTLPPLLLLSYFAFVF